jgi:dihydrofolate synthase/folylpolyglutamate synthase
MNYGEALTYLARLGMLGIQPGTERLATVLRQLGDPQEQFVAIHIAGTNGKGSTAAIAAALLVEAARQTTPALRIGLYTSPHLACVRERIQLSSEGPPAGLRECSELEFATALSNVQAAAEVAAVELTFFESLTAAAFVLFATQQVAVAVIETGLGGRLDATRLCRAAVTVITSIGFDHMELLGPTLAAIASEKAGIFRPKEAGKAIPALVACDDKAARAVIVERAQQVGAPLWLFDHHGEPTAQPLLPLPEALLADLALPGAHQRRNATLAVAAVGKLAHPLAAAARQPAVVQAGLRATRWPGRLERLWPSPTPTPTLLQERIGQLPPTGAEVWLDAAHNPEGATALADFLRTELPNRPLTVLFGAVAGKSVTAMVEPLRLASRAILTRPPSPRGLDPAALAATLAAELRPPLGQPLDCEADWKLALGQALAATAPGGRLLIYGSIFLVGAVRSLWLGQAVDPLFLQDPAGRRTV